MANSDLGPTTSAGDDTFHTPLSTIGTACSELVKGHTVSFLVLALENDPLFQIAISFVPDIVVVVVFPLLEIIAVESGAGFYQRQPVMMQLDCENGRGEHDLPLSTRLGYPCTPVMSKAMV
jgi:hypothetical protein